MSKHTHGPWHHLCVGDCFEVYGGGNVPWLRERVATTEPLLAESAANARLIAAAPDLLAALRVCLDSLMTIADSAGDVAEWNKGGHGYKATRKARAAIEAATGLHTDSQS